jgi:hypothetical protein
MPLRMGDGRASEVSSCQDLGTTGLRKLGKRAHTYEVGEIAYWSPESDVAIYYRQDGKSIPPPGIIPIGKIDAGAEAFDVPSSVKVTIELAK